MTRKEMIDKLVSQDIKDIRQGIYADDIEFLSRVLTGEGWKPYNQLSLEYLKNEYRARLEG